MNHGIFASRVIKDLGGTHKPVDGECPQIIQEAFPELTVEGANMQEVNHALVEAGVTLMDTFLVRKNGTVFPYECTTGHGCRVKRMLMLGDTTVFGHHVMPIPWGVGMSGLGRLAQQSMMSSAGLDHGHAGDDMTQERALRASAIDKATNEGEV